MSKQHGSSGSWSHGLLSPLDTVRLAMNTVSSYNRPHEAYYWGVGDAPWFEAFLPYLTPDVPVAGPAGLEGFARQYDELPASLTERYLQQAKKSKMGLTDLAILGASKAPGVLSGAALAAPFFTRFASAQDVLPASLTKKYLERW